MGRNMSSTLVADPDLGFINLEGVDQDEDPEKQTEHRTNPLKPQGRLFQTSYHY